MDIKGAVDQVAATLETTEYQGHKLRVFKKLEDVQPPCVWVAARDIDHGLTSGEVTVAVFIVAPKSDEYVALPVLGALLDLVASRLSPTERTEVVELNPTAQNNGLPALKFTTTTLANQE